MAEMVKIKYHGPPASHPVGGMATGQDYGNHADGDEFYVWPEDAEANPAAFTPADKAPAEEKAKKPNKSKGTAKDTGKDTQALSAPNVTGEPGQPSVTSKDETLPTTDLTDKPVEKPEKAKVKPSL